MNFDNFIDCKKQIEILNGLSEKYDFLNITALGKSMLGNDLPLITLGKGKKCVLYIGTHHALEWITSAVLLRFIAEYCEYLSQNKTIHGISVSTIFETRKIYIIPMLNPDGVDYALHGVDKDHILYERLLKMNGSEDFSRWQANARGVDLNHNYGAGFYDYKALERELGLFSGAPAKYSGEYPESEPETRALCRLCRTVAPEAVLTLHTQGEEIYFSSGGKIARGSLSIAKTIARLTGFSISVPSGTACYGGFTDWFIDEFDKPSFTLECGRGKNPLPFSDLGYVYTNLRRLLFTFPILI